MKRTHTVFGFLCLVFTVADQARSAPGDFAALREVADTFARKERAGFQLLKVDLTASHQDAHLQIHGSEFYYFGAIKKLTGTIPGVTTRVGDMEL